MDPRTWKAGGLALATGVLFALVAASTPAGRRLDASLGDSLTRIAAPDLSLDDSIVFSIDDSSLARLAPLAGPWPYRRDVWAHVLDYLRTHGAARTTIDVVLAEARPGDEQLRLALDRAPDTVLAGVAVPFPLTADTAGGVVMSGLGWHVPAGVPARPAADVVAPRPEFRRPGRVGIATVIPDDDGIVRRIPALHQVGGTYVPAIALAGLATDRPAVEWRRRLGGGALTIDGRTLPVDGDGQIELWFPAAVSGLPTMSFARLASAALTSRPDPDLSAAIKGRHVFVGATALLLDDAVQTPRGRVAGVEIVRLASSLLRHGAVLRPRLWLWDAFVLLAAMLVPLAAGAAAGESTRRLALALPLAWLAAGLEAIALLVALNQRTWVLPPLVGATAVAAVLGLLDLRRLRGERERLLSERWAAERASQMKTQFLNHVAHELRTPVAAIMGFSRLLAEEQPADARGEYARIIARNGAHLLRLVNNLLDDARLNAGRAECDPHPASVRQVLRDVLATVEGLPRGPGVELIADVADSVPDRVVVDELRLRQIVLNLVANAAKFTEHGRIRVAAAWSVPQQLTIAVEDTGPGIEPGALERIFEEFEFGHPGAARAGGTGLGLSVSRRLARLMQGELTVQSTLGVGSRFTLTLPAPVAEASPPAARASDPTTAVPTAQPSLAGWTPSILVCDDADDIRQLFAVVLDRAGAHVLSAADGLQAVQLAESRAPDAIVLDLGLPGLSGGAAVERIRAAGYAGPIIAVTGGAEDHGSLLRERGFTDVAEKPISGVRLVEILENHLPRWRPRRGA